MRPGYISVQGFVGKDPEIRQYVDSNGEDREFVNFPLGVTVLKRNKKSLSLWFAVSVFDHNLAKGVAYTVQKGDMVHVAGEVSCYKTKNGQVLPTIIAGMVGRSAYMTKKEQKELLESGDLDAQEDEVEQEDKDEDDIPF